MGRIGTVISVGCLASGSWAAWGQPLVCQGIGRTLRLSTLSPPGLHTVRKVLHVQLGPRWASAAEDHEGWDRQWAGDHAGHPAG